MPQRFHGNGILSNSMKMHKYRPNCTAEVPCMSYARKFNIVDW